MGASFAAVEARVTPAYGARGCNRGQALGGVESACRAEDETWSEIDVLIQRSQAKAYDEAVQLLTKLQDLAEYQSRQSAFEEHIDQFRDRYSRRPALMMRLREAGLIE